MSKEYNSYLVYVGGYKVGDVLARNKREALTIAKKRVKIKARKRRKT